MATSAMIPFIAPDGTTGSIPQDQVNAAIQDGGKLGVRIAAPDGTPGTIPMDRVHDAIKAGGQLVGMSGAAKPNVDVQPVNFARQPGTSYQTDEPVPTSGLGAFEYKHPVTSALAETAGIAGVGALGAMAGPPAVAAAQTFARAHPIISSMVAGEAISQARKIPYAGKLVPPYAEMLPYLIGKGKVPEGEPIPETAPEAASPAGQQLERTIAADRARSAQSSFPRRSEGLPEVEAGQPQAESWLREAVNNPAPEAETFGERVPAGKFAKELPNPNPYQFNGAPKAMDIVQSTNVGKVGYEPDSRTMTVEYKSGQVYSYHGVPQEIYQDALSSESVGSYVSRNIKGRYETVRRGSVLGKKGR